MTPEQQKHQDEYNAARRRYDNAYSDKRHAENQVAGIKNRRNQLINMINERNAEKKRNEDALSQLQGASGKNSDIDNGVRDAQTKLDTASAEYASIGEASYCKPRKLTEVFADKNTSSKNSISGAFEQIKTISGNLQRKISELQSQISQYEREIEDGKSKERYWNGVAWDKQCAMNSAAGDMAYHQRMMNA